ncbi:MAG: hypothetical protein OK454_07540 [Thaumarchaeota archaeon]|nr:hypothetical protein [Nitrososphaerota archaeon]
MGLYGRLRTIRVGDYLIVTLGGHSGYDSKIVLKRPGSPYHFTLSIRDPTTYSDPSKVPFYVHRADERTNTKTYADAIRGSIDFKRLASDVMSTVDPKAPRSDYVRQVNLETPELRPRKIFPFTQRNLEAFSKKELLLTEGNADLFETTTVGELVESKYPGMAISFPFEGKLEEGILVSTAETGHEIKVPKQLADFLGGGEGLQAYFDVEYEDSSVDFEEEVLEDEGEE